MAGSEGIDNDGDGQVNEDGPGTYDMNRNWPAGWNPEHVQGGAGDWPFSYPETEAVARFIMTKPNIAAGQAYHNAGGMILRGPGVPQRDGAYSGDRGVYESIGRVDLTENHPGVAPYSISGTKLREQLVSGERPDVRIIRENVADVLIEAYRNRAS